MRTTEQRFHAKVAPANAAGCWLWTAGTHRDGYGQFRVDGRTVKAHRFAWELANGPIPNGLHALHRCDARACCNHGHLFLGTPADNSADMWAKGRGRNGDQRGSKGGNARLTETEAVEVFLAAGTQEAIGARYGIHRSHVGLIKRRKKWASATEGLAA